MDVVTRFADLAGTTTAGTTQYAHDAAGRLTGIEHKSGSGGVLADYDYAYDAAGRLTAKTEDSVVTLFTHDDAGQLTADGASSFSYDGSGNRTNAGSVTAAGNRLTSDGTWTYTHDAAGQLVKKSLGASAETWTYGHDHRSQMTWAEKRATDGGTLVVRVEYAYDALGNRVRRVERDGSLAVVADERYALDGWDTAKPRSLGTEGGCAVIAISQANVQAVRDSIPPHANTAACGIGFVLRGDGSGVGRLSHLPSAGSRKRYGSLRAPVP